MSKNQVILEVLRLSKNKIALISKVENLRTKKIYDTSVLKELNEKYFAV